MNSYTEELFKSEEGEQEMLSHYRVWQDKYGRTIKIPVVDVRDGISYRVLAHQMSKGMQSKYMNYNEYHKSRKKY